MHQERDTVTENVPDQSAGLPLGHHVRCNLTRQWLWLTGGVLLVVGMWLCVWGRVNHNASARVLALVTVGMGVVYLALLILRPTRVSRAIWAAMIVVAILMRLAWFFVPASSGKDHCRYLWDGAVTANGINPYMHSPQQVSQGQVDNLTLERLAQSGCATLEGINHPELRTIYPPAAQGAFALAYRITPFDLTGWRIVLLGFDVLATLAVAGLLRVCGLPSLLAFVYLWNPLLVMETYHGAHLDMLAGAMVVLFAWSLVKDRPIAATIALTLAIGMKLWPVLLIPFMVRSLWGNWRRLALASGLLVALLFLMAVPFTAAFGMETNSGLLTYARIWSGRSGAYLVFDRFGWWLRGEFSLGLDGHYVGRWLMALLLLPLTVWLGLLRPSDTSVLCRRMGLVILLMLLLSPVLWPWYYVAVIPLAAVASPRLGLLLWTALLPLCYLEGAELSAWQLTWLVHVPVWLVLVAEWVWPRVVRRLRREAAHV